MKKADPASIWCHDFSVYDASFLQKICEARRVETGCVSLDAYEALLIRDSAEAEAFRAALHIGYSEFFRNPLTFAALEQIVLPLLQKKKRGEHRNELRIWSAGCAGGQEPYSLAMLLEEISEKSAQPFEYRIFATDACEANISAARTGVFMESSIGNMSFKRLGQWFTREGSEYHCSPRLARRIEFSMYNMLETATATPPSSIFGGFDLVVCCNLLFYYAPAIRTSMLEKLSRSLDSNAFLVTGETERRFIMESGFFEIFPQSAIFQPLIPSPRSFDDD